MIIASKSANLVGALLVALAASAGTAAAQAQSSAGIADKDAIFFDGRTFQVVPGKANDDFAKRIEGMGAREIGPGAIIFRSGDKLYIAGAPANTPALEPQKGPVFIEYEPPKNPAHQKIYELVKERHGLEIFKQLLSPFRLPVDITIKTLGCDGVANAYFDRDGNKRSIRICYEYLQDVMDKLPKETTPTGITPHDALVGQLMFALMHETGHAMFDIFQVPIWGHQEDAADQFATWIMLQFGGERAHRVIRGAAYSYAGFIKAVKDDPKVTVPLAAFSSDHGQPEERFFNLACIAYGYDPKIFAKIVDLNLLPQSRAKKCKFEYEDLTDAMHQLIGPHVDKELAKKVLADPWVTDNLPSTPSLPPSASAPAAFERPPAALK
jgi:hypothetical protein